MTINDRVVELAEKRVYTNDLDALEALILAGLPPDEMQAAAWVLAQRVRGLHDDLKNIQRWRNAEKKDAIAELRDCTDDLIEATHVGQPQQVSQAQRYWDAALARLAGTVQP